MSRQEDTLISTTTDKLNSKFRWIDQFDHIVVLTLKHSVHLYFNVLRNKCTNIVDVAKYFVKIDLESIITLIFSIQEHNNIWFHGCSNSGYAVTHSLDRNNYIVATCKRHLLAYDVQYKLFCITWYYYASKTDSTQRAQTIKMDRTIR